MQAQGEKGRLGRGDGVSKGLGLESGRNIQISR